MKIACVTAAFLSLTWVPAIAEDDERIAMGAGVSTCAQFNEFRKVDRDLVMLNYTAWAQGFMSAQNLNTYSSAGTYRQLSADIGLQQQFLIDFCEKFPNRLYANAVAILYETFPVRLKK